MAQHVLTLNRADAAAVCKRYSIVIPQREADLVDEFVSAYYELARGSIFIEAPDLPKPVVFGVELHGRRTLAIAAREYGDLSWPAYLWDQRRHAVGDAVRIVREGLADVLAWLEVSRAGLADVLDAANERVPA